MNIDILKKLIELATNNPNENEANSAARRVCKLIKEDNFKCLGSSSTNPQAPRTPPWQRGRADNPFSDMYEEILRTARAAEERERRRQADLLEKLRRQREEAARKEKERKEPIYKTKEDAPKWNWGYEPSKAQKDFFEAEMPHRYSGRYTGRDNFQGADRPSMERECSKCHGVVKTFRIMEEPFVCNVCQWNHWEAER